jgi:SAM-dependent methyltransferase
MKGAANTGAVRPPRDRSDMTSPRAESWRPPAFSPPATRPLISALRRVLDLQAGSIWRDLSGHLPRVHGNVLDVGCGAQPYRGLFGPNCSYCGIDTTAAKADFGYDVANTTYFEGDTWPVADRSIDFVLCTETLEHVPDPRTFLAQAARCLRPGGEILITTPFSARWHFVPHDYWRYTPSALALLLRAAGFDQPEVYARGNALTVACYKLIALLLPVLMPQRRGALATLALRLMSIPLIPFLLLFAAVGNLSLMGRGGDDCLGYTAIAFRLGDPASERPA